MRRMWRFISAALPERLPFRRKRADAPSASFAVILNAKAVPNLAGIALLAALAACNTTDALTPPAEIGQSSTPSAPLTQADTERMARGPVESQPLYERRGNPQNTLEAQAEALRSGSAVSPASSGPPPQWEGQAPAGGAAAATTAAAPSRPGAVSGSVRFLPIIGAPIQAVTPLSRRLGAQARAAGLTIRPSSDAGAEHMLKGYFSAFADGGRLTIVFVWDILDPAGNRLHRMQGQEQTQASGGSDPWAAVPAQTMETIADRTIADYVEWRRAQGR